MQKKQKKEYDFNDKLNIALKYSSNDLELAKKIVAGNYHDITIVKARFKNGQESQFGLLILYLSAEMNILVGITTCVGSSSAIYKHKPFDHWKSFEDTISHEVKSELGNDASNILNDKLSATLNSDQVTSILKYIDSENYNLLTVFFQETICEILEADSIDAQIETEKITAVDFEIKSNAITFSSQASPGDELDESESSQADDPYAGNTILKGKVGLSPVQGKDINLLTKGDFIKVLIDDDSEIAINIASKLEAYENDQMKPIVGEVESYYKNDIGHEIYVTIAPHVMVKIDEEESVKVATADSLLGNSDERASKRNNIIILTVSLAVLLLIILILIKS